MRMSFFIYKDYQISYTLARTRASNPQPKMLIIMDLETQDHFQWITHDPQALDREENLPMYH